MNHRWGKRLIMRGKPKEFAPATDSRAKKYKPTIAESTIHAASELFSVIYRNAQMFFVFGLVLGGLQFAYQGYFWASERVWQKFSALQLCQYLNIAPADSKVALTLDLVSPGVALASVALAIMIGTQLFIKRNSR